MPKFVATLCDRSGLIPPLHILTGHFKVSSNCQKSAEERVKALLKRSNPRNGGAGSLFVRVVEAEPHLDLAPAELPEGCRHVRNILDELELERAREREWVWVR